VNGSDSGSAAYTAAMAACGEAERVAVAPAARTIAGIDAMGHLRTWDARNGRCLLIHAFDRGWAMALAFDRQGDRLAVLLSEGTLVVFERRARDGLAWLQPTRSYPGPVGVEYRAKLSFGSTDCNVVVTTWADAMSESTDRIVEVSGVTASDAGSSDATDITQADTIAAGGSAQSSQLVRLSVNISGGQTTIVSRNAGARTGRITGAGLMAFWDDIGIERFEFDFVNGNVRFIAVRTGAPWTLLGTSTVEALGHDGWYAVAAALGACYDGKVTAFERGLAFP
jgi:hypothetical protein